MANSRVQELLTTPLPMDATAFCQSCGMMIGESYVESHVNHGTFYITTDALLLKALDRPGPYIEVLARPRDMNICDTCFRYQEDHGVLISSLTWHRRDSTTSTIIIPRNVFVTCPGAQEEEV